MSKTATIRARIEPKLKKEVENLLENLGISTSEAINIFYHMIKLRKGLPFSIVVPNETTRNVFEDTDADRNVIHCLGTDEMFKKLGI
ncbi:MAG: type II toxin-antitoxin system RelB/DinJ family antitoxin [bacterium]